MPEYTPYAKIPVPLWGEGDQVPPDLKRMALVIEQGLVIRVPTRADLTGAYNSLPNDTLAVVQADDTIWIRTGTGWKKVWSDSGLKTSNASDIFSAASGFIVLNSWARVRGGHTDVWVQLQRTGTPLVPPAVNTVTPLGSITAAYLPPSFVNAPLYGGSNLGMVAGDSTGAVRLLYQVMPAQWAVGEYLIFQLSYPEPGN